MFSIKSSLADCSKCGLLDENSCILETNCKSDLSKVELIIIAENPGKEEVKAEKPLKGKAGKTFRKYFEQFNLNKIPYLLTNVVLCQTIDKATGKTINPSDEVIERCKVNCFDLIEKCNPKLIVLMGASGAKAFGIIKKGTGGITSMRGKTYEWNGRKIFLTVHPSFVNRSRSYESIFESDFADVAKIMGGDVKVSTSKNEGAKIGEGVHYYNIPAKYYSEKYRLIDIQYLYQKNEVVYIFRTDENKKEYYVTDGTYYYYKCKNGVKPNKIIPYENMNVYEISFKDKDFINHDEAYEGDIRIQDKHAIDYYLKNKGEAPKIADNILFCDIEVDTGKSKQFPTPHEAKFPIDMISVDYNNKKTTFVLDNKTEKIKNFEDVEIKIYDNEKQMLHDFVVFVKKTDPDILSGWNFVSFDLFYIMNRLNKLGFDYKKLSNFEQFTLTPGDNNQPARVNLAGYVCLDQLDLYRMFTFTKKENYKLGNIAQIELGETKIQLPYPINEMYWKALNKTIEYNIKDTDLLVKLENKLGHINLLNEIRKICHISFGSSMSSLAQIDGLTISFLKKKLMCSKDADKEIEKKKYPGAFVKEPIPGVYNWVTDFDFSSLYPSIIMTYNIGVNNFVLRLKDPTLGYVLAYHPEKLPDTLEIIIDPNCENKEVTITRDKLLKGIKDKNLICTINGCVFKNHKDQVSVYSEILDYLLSSRKVYKKKMLEAKENKQTDEVSFNNTRQLVYKTIANSLYGIVANKVFRFFNLSCAAAITLSGQEALKTSIIYANNFMESLCENKEFEKPKELTKVEMYSDEMPERKTPYIVTGDTDSIFCCFEKFNDINIDKIQDYCDKVQKFLNEDVILNVVKRHNAPIETNRLELKNELIIARGLFLAKKRYCIYVVRQEGKVVDEIVSMGLDTKRSDYPKKTKDFLNELIDIILKSEKVSLKKLLEYIKKKEYEFISIIKRGEKEISKPVSFGKKIEDYKVIPQGVRGMVNWNDLMYDTHYPGTKAYQFKVLGIDETLAPKEVLENFQKNFMAKGKKLDVIAIPDEIDNLPNFIIVDVKDMLRYVFTERYESLLQPLINLKNNKLKEAMTF